MSDKKSLDQLRLEKERAELRLALNDAPFLAGHSTEAAQVDGAGFWDVLFKVKLPLIMSSVTICLFLTLSNCFKIYDVNVSLTGGGPNNATEMVSLNIYNEIFTKSHFGYGQAKAVVFFVIIALITFIQIKITGDKEVAA